MKAQLETCKKGDWVVHQDYGVGQIRGIEKKTLAGDTKKYLRVKTSDSSFWVAINSTENERVRPIASERKVSKALRVLQEPPVKMAKNYRKRRKRIEEDSRDGDLCSDAQLIRDLTARQYARGLNHKDRDALERVKRRFIGEWSLILGIEPEVAHDKLEDLLALCRLN